MASPDHTILALSDRVGNAIATPGHTDLGSSKAREPREALSRISLW
jgi:hypothetical protein